VVRPRDETAGPKYDAVKYSASPAPPAWVPPGPGVEIHGTAAEPKLQPTPWVGFRTFNIEEVQTFFLTAPLELPERTVDKATPPAQLLAKPTLHPKDGIQPCDRSNSCTEIATTHNEMYSPIWLRGLHIATIPEIRNPQGALAAAGTQDVVSLTAQMQPWNCECAISNRVASLPKKMK
jgi:hypothetical protein